MRNIGKSRMYKYGLLLVLIPAFSWASEEHLNKKRKIKYSSKELKVLNPSTKDKELQKRIWQIIQKANREVHRAKKVSYSN